ncbi:MAG: hypothetical protein GY845_13905 [Planctomycetes bacterium]|nr:hypothetical protein [Planctomycetota bacterium]
MSIRQNSFPTHMFLLAVYPVLYMFSQHLGEVQYREMVLPILSVLGFSSLMWILLSWFYRNRLKAGIVVSLFIFCFFFFGYCVKVMNEVNMPLRQRYILVLWILPLLCGVYVIKRTSKPLIGLTKVLNVFSVCLVGLNLFSILAFALKTKSAVPWDGIGATSQHAALKAGKAKELPDIYYIVPDRYARADVLKEMYDCDNSEFIDYLFEKGFYVASESLANYHHTRKSLVSSLNMDHLLGFAERMGEIEARIFSQKIRDCRVWNFLKSAGYRYVHLGSWWEGTYRNHLADENISLFVLPEFSRAIFGETLLQPILEKLGIYDENRVHWKNVPYKFEKLAEIPAHKGPTFVFAHIMVPHDPYVFDRDGKFVTRTKEASRSREENYREQVLFLNEKLKELVDRLLAASRVPPIIIIQADEGPFFERLWKGECALSDLSAATKAELRQKMAILNAYYLPGFDRDKLYPSITPVNSFRLIFNHYFGTDFDRLADESYIMNDSGFTAVTDRLRDQTVSEKIVDKSRR